MTDNFNTSQTKFTLVKKMGSIFCDIEMSSEQIAAALYDLRENSGYSTTEWFDSLCLTIETIDTEGYSPFEERMS